MAKYIKKYRNLSGLTTRRCPVCKGDRLIRAGKFLLHYRPGTQEKCSYLGSAPSVAFRRE